MKDDKARGPPKEGLPYFELQTGQQTTAPRKDVDEIKVSQKSSPATRTPKLKLVIKKSSGEGAAPLSMLTCQMLAAIVAAEEEGSVSATDNANDSVSIVEGEELCNVTSTRACCG